MASRVRVAASACLVASGLFMACAGGAIAIADPGNGYGSSDDRRANDSLGGVIRRALGMDSGQQDASKPRNRPPTQVGSGRRTTDPPTTTKPAPTTKPTPCPEPTDPPGQPPGFVESGGGGGGAIVELPRYKPPTVPDMQLPDELTPGEPGAPGGPPVLEAGVPVVAPGPVGAAAPIALPVIVAPPIGLGGGAGSPGTLVGPSLGAPRAVTAESPAGRIQPPANVGSNAAPASGYRIGYTEYLRTAGLPQVAALALPGIAGILVLTGAGGLVGYRQAKAGHAVRAGGTARFMR